ncbi:unnamed protein product [Gongylonema pulchrum]|uniref:Uncharacterized protein n=1 Tax=Gongylonema pulchrum TaxID=637853 RepID=A0A3P7RBH6_9BILA|nr:unnamed protein product [Gongylonema pulchrum]
MLEAKLHIDDDDFEETDGHVYPVWNVTEAVYPSHQYHRAEDCGVRMRNMVVDETQFVVKDSRSSTSQESPLPNRARRYTLDTTATTSAANDNGSSTSPKSLPTTDYGDLHRKFLEVVPEMEAGITDNEFENEPSTAEKAEPTRQCMRHNTSASKMMEP